MIVLDTPVTNVNCGVIVIIVPTETIAHSSACRQRIVKIASYILPVTSLPDPHEWYSIPEIADFLGVRQRDVRTMISDNRLIAVRRGENNALAINGQQIAEKDGIFVPLPALRGTLISLHDSGFSNDEAMSWLLRSDEELGQPPLDALVAGHTHAVRRVIRGLAF